MTNDQAFLSVETSLTGRRWVGLGLEAERKAEALAQTTGKPLALARVLAQRGVAPEEVEGFMAPALRDLLPDPRSLKDMSEAATRIARAVAEQEPIAVFADYDVDGGTSAALLLTWFRALGHDATLYVPDRLKEGYGPNTPAMEKLSEAHSLIIAVDCGTLSFEPIAAAKADVVVLDHHLGGETLPDAYAVVNPNRQDEDGSLGHLCAAGVVFLCLVEVTRQRREAGLTGPNLLDYLDLVALATVADVAPLKGVNRALVRQGLTVMSGRKRPGLTALADVSGLDGRPNAYHLGFLLGPRINAGGRIGRADLGARLLACADPIEARAMAEKLDELNLERREIEAQVREAALAQAEERGLDAPLVWAAGEGWHPGVVGIAAARLKELTNRPAVVIGLRDGIGQGSGRSIAGVDLGAAIQRVASEGLLLKGGGHKMAAGLSVDPDQLEPAMERLSELLARQGAGNLGPGDLLCDGVLMPGAATVELAEQIEAAGPYGAGAPAPRFAFPDMAIHHARPVGKGHLKVSFGDGMGGKMDAICFGAMDGPLGPALTGHAGARFHLAGRIEINHWQGRQTVQLRLEDAAPAS